MSLPSHGPKSMGFIVLTICLSSHLRATAGDARIITIEPRSIHLIGASAAQQIAVSIERSEEGFHDRTRTATYRIEPSEIASISRSGVLKPISNGQGTLTVELDGHSAEVPIDVSMIETKRPVSYRLDVTSVLSKAGCNAGACHGNLNGKGGFRLSLRGDDPAFDVVSLTREALARRVDRIQPMRSLIYLKPTGQEPHEGGLRFAPHSTEAETLLSWIASGSNDDVAVAPKLTTLSVFPRERLIPAPGRSQQLIVTAGFSDGSTRDVTRQASFDASDPTRVAVSHDGLVEIERPGEVTIAVRYTTGRGISQLAFLADRPNFAWSNPPAKNDIDRAVFAKLKALKINPTPLAGEAAFLRRAYLDALGVLPSATEARTFLADSDPDKRDKLIDRLLGRPEFADFWALKWADLLRNEEKTMGEKGVWIFQRWLRDQIAADTPVDQFARRIVVARGSTWANPPASFYRTNRDPQTAAETIGQVFLGVRLQCARCHNHPFDVWTQNDYYGLSAYFGNVARKEIANVRRDNLDTHEINGDEVIYLAGKPEMVQPRSGEMMHPKPPGGPAPRLGGDPNALDDLADWLTRDNPQFVRNVANRVWYHLLGRGIVDPVDDFRDSNPPSNPALLDALTAELRRSGMRLRPLVSLIMKSTTYQLGSTPNATNADDESNFSRAAIRLLPAETLLDAIGQALERAESFPNAPKGLRATQFAGVKGGDFLRVFGKPNRLLTCECERSESTTLAQAFQLINGEAVRRKLEAVDNRLGRMLAAGQNDDAILDEIYLASLSRFPTENEREIARRHLARSTDRRKGWEDVAWVAINSKEFLLRH
jgi:Protein of unknown function (DUF1549)/Protein of unknown function (DUF1553)